MQQIFSKWKHSVWIRIHLGTINITYIKLLNLLRIENSQIDLYSKILDPKLIAEN